MVTARLVWHKYHGSLPTRVFTRDCNVAVATDADFSHLPPVFTLRDFLASREAEIREQIKLLRAELAELKRAKAAVEQPDGSSDDATDGEVRDSGRMTIKEMVRTIFARPEAAQGMVAGEILDAVERTFNTKLERTSLSPQLSRLRESGDVVLQDGRWFPSEPRLSQASAITASPARTMHYGGGEMVTLAKAAEAARLVSATFASKAAVEEAVKTACSPIITRAAFDAAAAASATFSSAAAVEAAAKRSGGLTPAEIAAQSMPNTMKALEDADRHIQALTHSSIPRPTRKNWGSGPKTE